MSTERKRRALSLLVARADGSNFFREEKGVNDANGIEIKNATDEAGRTVGNRVQFSVEKSLRGEPNKCGITITNLSSHTRNEIVKKPLIVTLSAGYAADSRVIFKGDLRYGMSTPVGGVDYETKLEVAEGDRAYRTARVNRSFKPGTDVLTAIRDVARAFNLQVPRSLEATPELRSQFSSGISIYGPARDELDRLLAPFGLSWSIQNGALQVLSATSARIPPDRAWQINTGLGMLESPQWSTPSSTGEAPKLTLRSLLRPELTPGDLVSVASKETNGIFRIEKLTHAGDTDGDDWTTSLECRSAKYKAV